MQKSAIGAPVVASVATTFTEPVGRNLSLTVVVWSACTFTAVALRRSMVW